MTQISHPYQKLCTQYYNLDKPSAPTEALRFYMNHAHKCGGSILEPMCGTGNYLIPIMEAGCPITGFDNSSQMLTVCREKCQSKGLNPDIHQGSFEMLERNETYSLVIIPSSSLCLLTTDQELEHAINRIFACMVPDGQLVFEIETPFGVSEQHNLWHAHSYDTPEGSKLVLSTASHFDSESSVETILCRYELWDANRVVEVEVEDFKLRRYRTKQMEALLIQAGFEINSCTIPYSDDSAGNGAPQVLYTCTKKN